MSVYDQPDPSDIPGTSDFAYEQEQMRRDALISALGPDAKKLGCFACDIEGRYRVVVGDHTGVIVDGRVEVLHPTMFALNLDRATRSAILRSLTKRAATVAVVIHDDSTATVFDVHDDAEMGVPPDPARWCFDRLAQAYFGDAA